MEKEGVSASVGRGETDPSHEILLWASTAMEEGEEKVEEPEAGGDGGREEPSAAGVSALAALSASGASAGSGRCVLVLWRGSLTLGAEIEGAESEGEVRRAEASSLGALVSGRATDELEISGEFFSAVRSEEGRGVESSQEKTHEEVRDEQIGDDVEELWEGRDGPKEGRARANGASLFADEKSSAAETSSESGAEVG
jgi:hypothetical protein